MKKQYRVEYQKLQGNSHVWDGEDFCRTAREAKALATKVAKRRNRPDQICVFRPDGSMLDAI